MITVIYDLETSGFAKMPMFSKYHKILQICALRVDTGKVFTSYVNPSMIDLPPKSTAIHRITIDDVKNADTFDVVMCKLIKTLELEQNETVEFIAHNNNLFDELILRKEMDLDSLPVKITFWDTLPFLRMAYPKIRSYRLTDLYKHFYNTMFKNAHDAQSDVIALTKIYVDHIVPLRGNVVDKHESLRNECLVSIHMIGPWRASLIIKELGLETVNQLSVYFSAMVLIDPLSLDKFLKDKLNIQCVTQRMFVAAHVLKINVSSKELLKHISTICKSDTIDPVDYYIKYRYFVNKPAPNPWLYQRGLFMIKNAD
jgi:DNA polymerase III epsilon subunit-like protein